jgi:hypothetical protein
VASEGISQIKLNEKTCHVLTKEPDRPRNSSMASGLRRLFVHLPETINKRVHFSHIFCDIVH